MQVIQKILLHLFVPYLANCMINMCVVKSKHILYINSVSLSVSQSVEVLKPKSLLIKLEGPKTIQDFEFLLLTFTFTSVSMQQLPSSMGEVFLGFGRWVRIFGCVFFGLRV
jgi:hypothetical protein